VALIDSLPTGFRGNFKPAARFYEDDIRNTTWIREIFRGENPETGRHHAAIAEVVRSARDPLPILPHRSRRSPWRTSATRTARGFLDRPAPAGVGGRSWKDLDGHSPAP